MNNKITQLTIEQVDSFNILRTTMGSCATLCLPGTFVSELKMCGINKRETPRNQIVGCVVTQPSGSQLAIEAAFFDIKDDHDNSDLYVVNFETKTLTCYYKGWGTWINYYGNKHWENKDYLRVGTTNDNNQ